MCYQVRFITRSVKCMVTTRWMMEWLGNGFGRSMKDERTCTMRCEVGVHFGWMMIWWVRSTKKVVTTDVSQFLIRPCNFLRFQGLYSITLSVVIWVIGKCVHDGCPRCSQRSTKQRVARALIFLKSYHKDGAGMLSHTVTGDEIWVCDITPESKQQSLHWKRSGSPIRKKFKHSFYTRKIMCTIFWNR